MMDPLFERYIHAEDEAGKTITPELREPKALVLLPGMVKEFLLALIEPRTNKLKPTTNVRWERSLSTSIILIYDELGVDIRIEISDSALVREGLDKLLIRLHCLGKGKSS